MAPSCGNNVICISHVFSRFWVNVRSQNTRSERASISLNVLVYPKYSDFHSEKSNNTSQWPKESIEWCLPLREWSKFVVWRERCFGWTGKRSENRHCFREIFELRLCFNQLLASTQTRSWCGYGAQDRLPKQFLKHTEIDVYTHRIEDFFEGK